MVLERGQRFLELKEETLARSVAVGIHAEGCAETVREAEQHVLVGLAQERGRWYGHGFVSRGEHGPAVGAAFCDVERLFGAQHGDLLLSE